MKKALLLMLLLLPVPAICGDICEYYFIPDMDERYRIEWAADSADATHMFELAGYVVYTDAEYIHNEGYTEDNLRPAFVAVRLKSDVWPESRVFVWLYQGHIEKIKQLSYTHHTAIAYLDEVSFKRRRYTKMGEFLRSGSNFTTYSITCSKYVSVAVTVTSNDYHPEESDFMYDELFSKIDLTPTPKSKSKHKK